MVRKVSKSKERNPYFREGFTLIELLIVVAIVAILAAVTLVALNPLRRFQDSRDSIRWSDITNIADGIRIHQLDNSGAYLAAISALTAGQNYMIVNGDPTAMTTGCSDNDASCDIDVVTPGNCVNLGGLTTGPIASLPDIPVSPSSGTVTWDSGSANGDEGTGYVLTINPNNSITITACESENTALIEVTR